MNDTRKPRRRWFQFSLRSLFVVMTMACIGMSWVGVKMQKAKKQKEAVEAIVKLGGVVYYDYQLDAAGRLTHRDKPPEPAWMRHLLGEDICVKIAKVSYDMHGSEARLEHIEVLTDLQRLHIINARLADAGLKVLTGLTQLQELWLVNTDVTDAGLEPIKRIPHLRDLSLVNTQVTDKGLEHLKGLTQLQELVAH